jgi:hypothetical protein
VRGRSSRSANFRSVRRPRGPLEFTLTIELRSLNDPILSINVPQSSIFDESTGPTIAPCE